MVKEISTRGFLSAEIGDLDGWAASEFSEATLELLESLEVPVPEIKEPKQHPWGLPQKQLETGEVVGYKASSRKEAGGPPVLGKKKPGPKKRERRVVSDDVIARLLAAKRRK